ncbi:hypothetical protein, conserved [Trypanosoma brucei brucei TREU927]|uniref:Uncharacterized protein n=1 Tax=Trypanosoma brucei brucei (strain 927/4 GUTat10.1) TaxID=185431 RepID=Q38CL3_TRYB2|nr:hypothetical protein, conserved [Trypanosoma brucei brucei TREU927]EAN77457.1 hypothetical protein, conserved [Trypanosoma brucei brucei TREU927]
MSELTAGGKSRGAENLSGVTCGNVNDFVASTDSDTDTLNATARPVTPQQSPPPQSSRAGPRPNEVVGDNWATNRSGGPPGSNVANSGASGVVSDLQFNSQDRAAEGAVPNLSGGFFSLPLNSQLPPHLAAPKDSNNGLNLTDLPTHTNSINCREEVAVPARRTKPKSENCLAKLYYSGMARRKRVEERLEILRARDKELRNCTFKPVITDLAKTMERPGAFPYCRSEEAQLRQRALLETWESKIEKECRPTPKISKGSEQIVQRVRSSSACVIPVADRLYMESARRQCRKQEEEEKGFQQTIPLRRSASDVNALIHRLYELEEKRVATIERKRGELWLDTKPKRRCENSEQLVERLYRPTPRRRRPCKSEPILFSPQVNETTKELSLRANRRRLEQWHQLWSKVWKGYGEKQERQIICCEHLMILKKIDDVARSSGLTGNCTLNDFCTAMEDYERTHGVQHWRLTPLPLKPHVNEDLTFSPVILPSHRERKGSPPAHQRLFEAAKAKQLQQREEERKRREEELRQEEKSRAVSRRASRRSSKQLDIKDPAEKGASAWPCSPTESVSSTDHSRGYKSVELSSLSPSSSPERMPVGFSPPPVWLTPGLIEVAEDLKQLMDEPRGGWSYAQLNHSRTKVDAPPDATLRPSPSVGPKRSGSNHRPLRAPQKKKKRRPVSELLSDELLLECAASRCSPFSWNVSARNREHRDSNRRLRNMGKLLYHKM